MAISQKKYFARPNGVLAPLKGSFVHVVQPLFLQLGRGILTLPGRRGLVETVRMFDSMLDTTTDVCLLLYILLLS